MTAASRTSEPGHGLAVQLAVALDRPQLLALAGEAEPLFGPMVREPGFHDALSRNLARRTALCVREGDAAPGAVLLGALLFSPNAGSVEIGWLDVADRARRRGVGRALVEHVIGLVPRTGEVSVTSFGPDNVGGQPAGAFFEALGFRPAGPAPSGPEGGSREVFRLTVG